jgi:hypothetical protein
MSGRVAAHMRLSRHTIRRIVSRLDAIRARRPYLFEARLMIVNSYVAVTYISLCIRRMPASQHR